MDIISISKRTVNIILFTLIVVFSFSTSKLSAQNKKEKTRILFIFDASQSMNAQWENNKKIKIAKKILIRLVDSLSYFDNIEMGLRVYGHQSNFPPQDCDDTKLEIPFSGKNNAKRIKQKLWSIKARGTTPISNSLAQAPTDFVKCNYPTKDIVILITDGVEACSGNPCYVSKQLQEKGIILKPYIIGIGIDDKLKDEFKCAGTFLDVNKESELGNTLEYVISQVLHKSSLQINLLDKQEYPSETNVAMSFYDSKTNKVKYHLMHTMNSRGFPDTLYINPKTEYKLVVHTLPSITKNNINLNVGKHTTIGIDASQSYLQVNSSYSSHHKNTICVISKNGKIINYQTIGDKIKYLTGTYTLDILTLPKIHIDSVEIKENISTKIDISRPGILTINKPTQGKVSIFEIKNKKLIWVYDIPTKLMRETIYLQPGDYNILYQKKNSFLSQNTKSRFIQIKAGSSELIKL